jgi:hypothetical protein
MLSLLKIESDRDERGSTGASFRYRGPRFATPKFSPTITADGGVAVLLTGYTTENT